MEKWQKAEEISTDNTRQKSQGRQNKVLVGLYGKIAELAIILKLFIHSINNENIRELFIITEKFFKKECFYASKWVQHAIFLPRDKGAF